MACQTLNFWGTVTKITKNILKAKSYQTGRVRTVRTPIGIHAQNAFVKNLATNIWYKIVFQGPDMGSLKKVLMNASDVPPECASVPVPAPAPAPAPAGTKYRVKYEIILRLPTILLACLQLLRAQSRQLRSAGDQVNRVICFVCDTSCCACETIYTV